VPTLDYGLTPQHTHTHTHTHTQIDTYIYYLQPPSTAKPSSATHIPNSA